MITKIILLIASAYLLLCALLYLTQERLIFPGMWMSLETSLNTSALKGGIEEIKLEMEDGTTLDGMRTHSGKDNTALVIYFGGNADNVKDLFAYHKELKGSDIIAFNYRGYAKSQGSPSEKKLFEDALAIYDKYAKDREVIVAGRSLGSGVAAYLGAKRDVAGVILITPFDSVVSIAKENYPFIPIELLLKHRFQSDKYVKEIEGQIAVIELKDDKVVSNDHTKKLIQAIDNPIHHTTLQGSTHGNILEHPDFFKEFNKAIDYIKMRDKYD